MKRNTSVEEEFFAYGEGANGAHDPNDHHFKAAPTPSPFSKIIQILLIIVLIALLIVLGIIGYMYAKKAFAEHQGAKPVAAVEKKKQHASTTAPQSSLISQGVSTLTTATHSNQSKSSLAAASFVSQTKQTAAVSSNSKKSVSAQVQSTMVAQKVQSVSALSQKVAQSTTNSSVSSALASVQASTKQTKKVASSSVGQKSVQEMSDEELIEYLRSLKPDQLKNIDIEKLILERKKSSGSKKKVAVAKTEYLNNQVVLDKNIQKKKKEATPIAQLSQKLAAIVKTPPVIKEAKEKSYIKGLVREAQTREAVNRYYIVAPGDTLSKIAKRFYGQASAYVKIYEANQDIIKDPKLIFPGQKLRIPKY